MANKRRQEVVLRLHRAHQAEREARRAHVAAGRSLNDAFISFRRVFRGPLEDMENEELVSIATEMMTLFDAEPEEPKALHDVAEEVVGPALQ